ncbi:Putative ribonuclease H protein [Dendrobium catenatum]|uniref:Ribonuclease H protein n=1 Tax=Dendrobium catenatum TaxID=906689 RepID=A0A2I0W469_9ASPA|nr:Putative ribonuclease H protein [Dendrobium catenatum]
MSQRSKARWLQDGEDDLKFLYANINVRHNSNQIRGILVDGILHTTSDHIAAAFVNHFQKIFNGPHPLSNCDLPLGNSIPNDQQDLLIAPFTMDDIKEVIFSSPKNAAPGPDGYTFEFYRAAWNTLGKHICNAVQSFFHTSFLPRHAKNTVVALIPKSPHASSVNDYRPISLCNTFYKIIAKLLANRMKMVMPYIIHPAQTGFIKNRIITDNIILASEILSTFNKSAKNHVFCAKFDIHKAFDTVSREFILRHMQAKGFPPIFADDLLVFSKADLQEAANLSKILNIFEKSSGLKVNPLKSSILFSKNCPLDDDICELLNIKSTSTPLKYLGLPIFLKKLTFADFNPLIKKITSALEGWRAKTLSFGGRTQFLKYTIFNTIAYWIRGSIMPKRCFQVLNKICARFLFSRDTVVKKLRLIAWKDTCIPKTIGGLGIPSMDSLSYSFNCSTILIFLNEENNLLFNCWRERYCSLWLPSKNSSSLFWKKLCLTAHSSKHCWQFRILFNCQLSFLWDPWCFGKSIMDLVDQNVDSSWLDQLSKVLVSHFLINSTWNCPSTWPSYLVNQILLVPIWNIGRTCLWYSADNCSNMLFRKEFFKGYPVVNWHRFIWHKRNAIRFSSFGWMAVRNGLKTADNLLKRGINVNPSCSFCLDFTESHSHLFFECDFSFSILNSIIPHSQTLLLRPNLFQVFDLIEEIADNAVSLNFYSMLINIAIYYIWRARNDRIFGNIIECHTTVFKKIKKAALAKLENWAKRHLVLHLLD